jgi:hypothetical protein
VPVQSKFLYVAGGLAKAPLPPILVVLGSARFVNYVLWVSAANVADRSLREVLGARLGGWGTVALQLAGFTLIVLLTRLDWRRLLQRRLPAPSRQSRDLNSKELGDGHPDDCRA